MNPKTRAGALGGLAGGVILLAIALLIRFARLMPYDWISVAADVFFPRNLAYEPSLGQWLGTASHLLIAVFFGLVFVYMLDLRRDRNYFWLGVGYGVVLEIVNLGVVAPALRLLAPVWEMNLVTIAITTILHVAYGVVLALIVHIFAETIETRTAS